MSEKEQIIDRLSKIVKPEKIPIWLDTPNNAFDGLTPNQVMEKGRFDKIWNMIYSLESDVVT